MLGGVFRGKCLVLMFFLVIGCIITSAGSFSPGLCVSVRAS